MKSFFEKIVDVLNKEEIPYMLSGSVAMSVYILPRATRDIDFVVHLQPKDIERFAANFKEGYYCDIDEIIDAVRHSNPFNIIDFKTGFKADFVVLKNEPYRLEEFNRKVKISFFEKDVYIVSVEDLLLSKLIWIQQLQSTQQTDDIKSLSTIATLDWTYIKKWIKALHLTTFELIPND